MKAQNLTHLNLHPKQVSCYPHLFVEEIPKLGNYSEINPVTKEPKGGQLTIFFAGEVMVYDDFPADKAKEIMSFAGKGISQSHNNCAYAFAQSHPTFPANMNMVRSSASPTSPFPFNVTVIPNTGSNSVQEHPQPPSRPVICDLPLTRKASLHRFLEKRKHRIAARAPYLTSNPMTATYKSAESMPWLALAPQSPQEKSETCSSFV